jgi:tetratricopeptide (TPR) repeat protein
LNLKKLYFIIGLVVVAAFVIILVLPDSKNVKDSELPPGHPEPGTQGPGANEPGRANVKQDIMQRIETLRQRIQSASPGDTAGALELAQLVGVHKPDEAAGLYERVIKKDPKNIEVMTELTVCYYNMGQMDKALAVTERILAIKPSYTPAHYNLGAILAAKGEKEKARRAWEKLMKEYPNSPDAKRAGEAIKQI